MPLDLQVLGSGVYTPREAARLAGTGTRDVLRWTRGGAGVEPLWRAYYHLVDGSTEISFRDMLEVRVVAALRQAGVSLQAIRFATQFAEERYKVERPLSSRRFRTDGSEILIEALDGTGELTSLSPKRAGQIAFRVVVEQSLIDLEYEDDDPILWRPRRYPAIVIDPRRAFGDPILDISGISTRTLCREAEQDNDVGRIAKLYEVDSGEVKFALAFEHALDGQRPV
jgi:uncharacterized protein (DUF433 family)